MTFNIRNLLLSSTKSTCRVIPKSWLPHFPEDLDGKRFFVLTESLKSDWKYPLQISFGILLVHRDVLRAQGHILTPAHGDVFRDGDRWTRETRPGGPAWGRWHIGRIIQIVFVHTTSPLIINSETGNHKKQLNSTGIIIIILILSALFLLLSQQRRCHWYNTAHSAYLAQ